MNAMPIIAALPKSDGQWVISRLPEGKMLLSSPGQKSLVIGGDHTVAEVDDVVESYANMMQRLGA